VYQTEKNLKEYKDRVPTGDVTRLEGDVESLKNAIKSGATSEIKTATERLNATWQEVAQRMYQQAAPEGAGAPHAQSSGTQEGPSSAEPGPGGAVDAEYEVIDGEGSKKSK